MRVSQTTYQGEDGFSVLRHVTLGQAYVEPRKVRQGQLYFSRIDCGPEIGVLHQFEVLTSVAEDKHLVDWRWTVSVVSHEIYPLYE